MISYGNMYARGILRLKGESQHYQTPDWSGGKGMMGGLKQWWWCHGETTPAATDTQEHTQILTCQYWGYFLIDLTEESEAVYKK